MWKTLSSGSRRPKTEASGRSARGALRREDTEQRAAESGESALTVVAAQRPALVVLDLMLAAMDGLEVCRRLRAAEATRALPVIMLTAKATEVDRVLGLEFGADDYVTKPFSPRELVARVRAVLRRTHGEDTPAPHEIFERGRLRLDFDTYEAFIDGERLGLSRLALERHQIETLGERLLAEARLAGEALPWTAGAPLDAACAQLAADLGVRLSVIASDGRVLGESARSSESLENHADRPEFRTALATGQGRAVRQSGTIGVRLLYTAWRQTRGEGVRVVRTALPLTAVAKNVAHLRRLLVGGLLAAMLLGLATSLGLSRRLLRRIQRLVAFARAVAGGAPAPYLAPERHDDLGVLEAQLADMAREVAATIAALRVERERLEAILRGMVEGVLVTDLVGRVALMNERARELLALPAGHDGAGRPLVEVARQPQVSETLRALAAGSAVISRDLTLDGAERTTLQVNGARLCGPDGQPFGYVLVLHDVSELRRLEVIRRDFVANVSHDLRSPLTAMKGYAETLLGPAGDDRETRRRFLSVIDRHSERLGRLIDDLLTLSDLELGRSPLRLGMVAVAPAVEDVLQILSDPAARGGVDLGARIDPATPALEADADRFRQVLINLC